MYYPYFITYMVCGFVISLVVFFWALNNSQFTEQKRARFLPLEGEPTPAPLRVSRFSRIETWGLFALVCLGLLASASVVVFALWRAG